MTSSGSAGARSATAVRTALVAALVGATGVGSYGFFSEHTDMVPGATTASGPSMQSTSGQSSQAPAEATPFTTADAGSCVTWQVGNGGELTYFERTDCNNAHRFEVSVRENLATYPTSEFGPQAQRPDVERQAQLREELCQNATLQYLDGAFDPSGRYSIASILPPADKWAAGDRTLLCGVQSTDSHGQVVETQGFAAEQDQARTFVAGTCVAVSDQQQLSAVDCAAPHQLEATQVVDLKPVFPDHTPSVEEQDKHLRETCEKAAMDFLGGEENLYQSTLQPYWIPLQPASWAGGSHSTNCYLVHANEGGGFSELAGSATAGTSGFTINGTPPPPQPEREPLRKPPA
ncbi:septum formation family protein [Corynebacterium tapiri]|uniref:Septum formation-related domain-containing protein n=1 Tax=Corynebacterium tapiri TaxID=1448266 RepID=A0A5C4U1M0_9CORY|nr:septum formation family protein [Corynebacterium tapiri]TNL95600.1 hypothetical protein FHE74_09580 [Corynebacterium tapiri]